MTIKIELILAFWYNIWYRLFIDQTCYYGVAILQILTSIKLKYFISKLITEHKCLEYILSHLWCVSDVSEDNAHKFHNNRIKLWKIILIEIDRKM